jgi:ABC-type multidrug transport system fused ATPase/permease subunit
MKTHRYSLDSWHASIVKRYGNINPEWETDLDICTYVKAVGVALFLMVMLGSVAAGFFFMVMHPFIWLIWCAVHATWVAPDEITLFFLAFMLFIFIALGMAFLFRWMKAKKAGENSFVKDAYQSLHEKVCFKITFE